MHVEADSHEAAFDEATEQLRDDPDGTWGNAEMVMAVIEEAP